MKFILCFKTPDILNDIDDNEHLTDDEREKIIACA